MPRILNEQEALKTLYELEPSYKFRFEGGYKGCKVKNLHICCDKGHQYITRYKDFVSSKTRCSKCSGKYKPTTEEALSNLKEIQSDYSFRFENGYKNAQSKNLHVTCNHGHEYITRYSDFQQGVRCPHCNGKVKLTEEEALKALYELEPSYTFNFKDGYKNALTKNLHVICDKGHEYIVKYSSFQQGQRCSKCAGKYKPTTEEALKVLKELEPNYTFKFDERGYINNIFKNLHVTCSKNHSYTTRYNDFKKGCRCPHCVNIKSKPETEIINFIKSFYDKDIEHGNRSLIKNIYSGNWLELDIYLPDISLALEFNGKYWHSDEQVINRVRGFNTAKEYHEYKTQQCQDIGITLLHIDEEHYISNKNTVLQSIKETIQHYINNIKTYKGKIIK